MNTPIALLGTAILFWGWQTGHWAVAVPCALLIEAARFMPRRWAFSAERLNRIGDVCAVITLVLGAALYVTLGNPRAVTQLFLWLPAAYLPLALSQAYGTHRQISLGVLFWSMRRHRSRAPVHVNFAYPYGALWIVAASAANRRDGSFEIGLIALVAWALWQARPRSRGWAPWLLLVPLAAGAGYAGHHGLHDLQLWLEGNAAEWLGGDDGSKTDPYRADTDLGHIGSLKQSDRIVMRVRTAGKLAQPLLLHRASYDSYTGLRWLAKNAPFAPVPPTGGTTWTLSLAAAASATTAIPGTGAPRALQQADIVEQTAHGRPVLALPAGTLRIEALAASEVNQNALGAVQVEHRPGFVPYRVVFAAGMADAVAPRADDLVIPKREADAFSRIARTLGLGTLAPADALAAVQGHFANGFGYSLAQSGAGTGAPPLVDFIERTRAGHCEYFASATVLLLRAGGIPARYATGYSVQEWNDRESAYVVRVRHAHAWVRAWINGTWREIDTTPASWAVLEADAAPWWSAAADWWSWLRLRFAEMQSGQTGTPLTWIAAGIGLALWIGWRLFGRPARSATVTPPVASAVPVRGHDSPFYRIERHLAAQGWQRAGHETMREWLARISPHLTREPGELAMLLRQHYRCRFDPGGLPAPDRADFASRVDAWLAADAVAATAAKGLNQT